MANSGQGDVDAFDSNKSVNFQNLTAEYKSQLRSAILKIVILSMVILVFIFMLLSYYGQRSFIDGILKSMPFGFHDTEKIENINYTKMSAIKNDYFEIVKIEYVVAALNAYKSSAEHISSQIDEEIKKQNAKYFDVSAIISNQGQAQLLTINGNSSVYVVNYQAGPYANDGSNSSWEDGAVLRVTANIYKIDISTDYRWSNTSQQINIQFDRENRKSYKSPQDALMSMKRDDWIVVLSRTKSAIDRNISDSSDKLSQYKDILSSRNSDMAVAFSRMSTTEEIFYMTIFNRVLSAAAMFSIIAICLRLIVNELRYVNTLSKSYFSFMYAEAGTGDISRIREVSSIISDLDGREVLKNNDDKSVSEILFTIVDAIKPHLKGK